VVAVLNTLFGLVWAVHVMVSLAAFFEPFLESIPQKVRG